MMLLGDKILLYNAGLHFPDPLPEGTEVMNPFQENPAIQQICRQFYHKFYSDNERRHLILGINPGRLGAGATGIPFTDTKRLIEKCGLPDPGFVTHEPSSVFVYDMIEVFGGAQMFYQKFYISSVFPLGFIRKTKQGKYVNFNYYDDIFLQNQLTPYIIEHLNKQIELCGNNDVVFCLGRGKNFAFLQALNKKHGFFGEVVPLEHPRFIMQYRSKTKVDYIVRYLEVFRSSL